MLTYQLDGFAAGDRVGFSTANAGDVDADGHDDILLGGIGANSYGGVAALYSGRTGQLFYSLPGLPDSHLGFTLAGTGDLTGDGIGNFLVGAPSWWGTGVPGRVYLYSGNHAAVTHTFSGGLDESFGSALAGGKDVDGDGMPDFLIGAPGIDGVGSAWTIGGVYVMSGATGQLRHYRSGQNQDDAFGEVVSGLGDIDGDGHDDYMVGCPEMDPVNSESGSVLVYSGGTGQELLRIDGQGLAGDDGHLA